MTERFLLINPWIYDFAAFDMWARPLGLLYIGSLLRTAGYEVDLIDCTDRFDPEIKAKYGKAKQFGCGRYHSQEVEKPPALRWVKRRYKRYGMPIDMFVSRLRRLEMPTAIFITSRMTYWYPGVQEAIRHCRALFGGVPIVLGGIYPTLCPQHAQTHCDADFIITGEGEWQLGSLLSKLSQSAKGLRLLDPDNLDSLPLPAFDLLGSRASLPVQTSRGCPFRCTYCAAWLLSPRFRRREPERVGEEIYSYARHHGTMDFAFYDDALLLDAAVHFERLLHYLIQKNVRARFHTPNGLAFQMITYSLACKMFQVGFKTIRLSLETASQEHLALLNRSQSVEEFRNAVRVLRAAGFRASDIGVYLMLGLPGQTEEELTEGVRLVLESGAMPKLAEYSPIPGTKEWQRAVEGASMNIADEPLLHNNSVYYRLAMADPWGLVERLRALIRPK
jgi:radical SAM superfamily enzyme YgiQ (UPF0313 family)